MNSDCKAPHYISFTAGTALAALLVGGSAWAQQPLAAVNIPAKPVALALTELAHETGVNVLFSPEAVQGLQSVPVNAKVSPDAAARLLLAGTRLDVLQDQTGALIVRDRTASGDGPAMLLAASATERATAEPIAQPGSQAVAGDVPTEHSPAEAKADATHVAGASMADLASGLEEIIVTAQKREESLQKTPIAITAFGVKELETQRVSNVMELVNKVPSLNLAPFAATRASPNLFIRGMGNLNTQTTKDNATGIYIDGVPVGRSMGLAADIADLERIEVLRGPQGTLWGRNTTAGAINFITQKPNDDLSLGIQLTAGSWNLRSGRMKVNAPITENLFLRAAYMRTENDGWVDNRNRTSPNQINFNEDRRKEAMKIALRFLPTDSFTVDYTFDKSEMIFGNHFYQLVGGPTAVSGRQRSVDSTLGLLPSSTEVSGHNLTLAWDLGSATLKSITAYRDLESWTFMNFIDAFTQTNDQDQNQFSQEVQLVGDIVDGRIRYAMGVFYFEEDSYESLISAYSGGALLDVFHVTAKGRSAAVYGQATWTPPILDDRLGLTLGMRYTEDSRKAVKTFDNPGLAPAFLGLVIAGDRDFSSFDPAVTIDYAFTDLINAYAKYSTGYRAGGYNTQSQPDFFGLGFDQETVKAWEVGIKSELLDRRLRLNIAAFRNTYDDLQVDQARTPPIYADTLNAGAAEIKGVEVEATALLARGLEMNFFYSWLDGKYKSYIDNGMELASVRHMPNSPKWHVGAGLDYMLPPTSIGDFSFHIDYRRQDEFFAGPIADTLTPGYDTWNARIQLANVPAPGQGTFRVSIWGKNLGNEIYRYSTTNLGIISAQFGPPRSVGVDASYEF